MQKRPLFLLAFTGLTFSLLLWQPLLCLADNYKVSVMVSDSAGNPVADAVISASWFSNDGKTTSTDEPAVVTNSEGKASFDFNIYGKERPALVLSKDQSHGAIIQLQPKHADEPLAVTLVKTVKVKGKLHCEDIDLSDGETWTNIQITPGKRRGMSVLGCQSGGKGFEFILPPGDYALFCYGQDLSKMLETVEVSATEDNRLEPIVLEASGMLKLKGKPAPDWVIKEARGIDKKVKLSDYKGKWVLLEFWGHW